MQRRLAHRPPLVDGPPVSVVIPIKALEECFEDAQDSIFNQNYPDFDVTITAQDLNTPAVALSARVLAGAAHAAGFTVKHDAFFDTVMVNADDPALKANRLALLNQLHRTMNRVADLSRLAA